MAAHELTAQSYHDAFNVVATHKENPSNNGIFLVDGALECRSKNQFFTFFRNLANQNHPEITSNNELALLLAQQLRQELFDSLRKADAENKNYLKIRRSEFDQSRLETQRISILLNPDDVTKEKMRTLCNEVRDFDPKSREHYERLTDEWHAAVLKSIPFEHPDSGWAGKHAIPRTADLTNHLRITSDPKSIDILTLISDFMRQQAYKYHGVYLGNANFGFKKSTESDEITHEVVHVYLLLHKSKNQNRLSILVAGDKQTTTFNYACLTIFADWVDGKIYYRFLNRPLYAGPDSKMGDVNGNGSRVSRFMFEKILPYLYNELTNQIGFNALALRTLCNEYGATQLERMAPIQSQNSMLENNDALLRMMGISAEALTTARGLNPKYTIERLQEKITVNPENIRNFNNQFFSLRHRALMVLNQHGMDVSSAYGIAAKKIIDAQEPFLQSPPVAASSYSSSLRK